MTWDRTTHQTRWWWPFVLLRAAAAIEGSCSAVVALSLRGGGLAAGFRSFLHQYAAATRANPWALLGLRVHTRGDTSPGDAEHLASRRRAHGESPQPASEGQEERLTGLQRVLADRQGIGDDAQGDQSEEAQLHQSELSSALLPPPAASDLELMRQVLGFHVGAFAMHHLPMEVGRALAMGLAVKLVEVVFVRTRDKAGWRRKKKGKEGVTFNDVIGCDEAKVEIMQVVDFLKDPTRYSSMGAKPPRGILLVGEPGTGKTMMAKACAGEAKVPFIDAVGSDFNNPYAGLGVMKVKALFKQARQSKRSIVFIDELDYLGRKRGSGLDSSASVDRESSLTQLLSEMDGFGEGDGVVVIATTNRASDLDPALVRSGRFDMHISFDPPDKRARQQLFRKYLVPSTAGSLVAQIREGQLVLQPMTESPEGVTEGAEVAEEAGPPPAGPSLVPLDDAAFAEYIAEKAREAADTLEGLAAALADLTPGVVGADVQNICQTAARIAVRQNVTVVTREHYSAAIDRVTGGLEKTSKIVPQEERVRTAVHESGHALAGWMLPGADPVTKVSIIWRGSALGFTQRQQSERLGSNRQHYLDFVCMALSGRAAEEVLLGAVSDGASQDLQQASAALHNMITRFGFGQSLGLYAPKEMTAGTAERVGKEVQHLLDQQYRRAMKLVRRHRHMVRSLVELLLEAEVVHAAELETVFGPQVKQSTTLDWKQRRTSWVRSPSKWSSLCASLGEKCGIICEAAVETVEELVTGCVKTAAVPAAP